MDSLLGALESIEICDITVLVEVSEIAIFISTRKGTAYQHVLDHFYCRLRAKQRFAFMMYWLFGTHHSQYGPSASLVSQSQLYSFAKKCNFLAHFSMIVMMLLLALNYVGVRLFVLNGGTGFMFGLLRSSFSIFLIPVLLFLYTSSQSDPMAEQLENERSIVSISGVIFPVTGVVVCGAIRQMAIPIALMFTTVSHVGVIQPAVPVFTTIIAICFRVEKPSTISIISILFCFLGLGVAEELWKNFDGMKGFWLLLLIPITKGLQIVGIQMCTRLSSLKIQLFQILGIIVFVVPFFFYIELEEYSDGKMSVLWNRIRSLSMIQWLAIFYSLIAVILISWRIQIWCVQAVGSITVATYQCLQPVFSFFLARFILGEALTAARLGGSAIICASLLLSQLGKYYTTFKEEKASLELENEEYATMLSSGQTPLLSDSNSIYR
ncbi:putative drug/metabolite transporter DMT1 [Cardiosporidium cionae]|uniref:Drug/metabolite transporter DMT1 n=1 Tax=Cardiosporidium cionae TaxID=476202 RepID=A0ABQ7JDR7_9APIC|nr:putative drug/metabolite transporter DMT1 [Cardiosporidium cionae]|eukprot:KAF8822171.1 putative drug/metabolite transporter DMT1 [Cardiosporidium cionae]